MQVELGFKLSSYIPDLLAKIPRLADFIPAFVPAFIRARLEQILDNIQGRLTQIAQTYIDNLKTIIDQQQDRIEGLINNLIDNLSGPLAPLIKLIKEFKTNGLNIIEKGTRITKKIEFEYSELRNFKLKTGWKGRVVSVPNVIKQVRALVDVPHKLAQAGRDLVNAIKEQLNQFDIDAALEDIEGLEGFSDLLARLGPRIAKAGERLLGIFALVVSALVTINQAADDIETIIDQIELVRDDIENLDLVFLQQNNPRKIIQSDEGPIKVRIGRFHSA